MLHHKCTMSICTFLVWHPAIRALILTIEFRSVSIALGISWAVGHLPASRMGKANASDLPLDVPVVRHR